MDTKQNKSGKLIDVGQVKASDPNKLKAIQLDLKSKGLYKGKIDGVYGPLTEAAIYAYNSKNSPKPNIPYSPSATNTNDSSGSKNMSPNDFIYSQEELKKYQEIYDQRIAECKIGDTGCLKQANTYYNKFVAPKLKAMSSWQELEAAGAASGNKNNPEYGGSIDAWDVHGVLQKAGGTNKFTSETKARIQKALDRGDKNAVNKILRELELPIGSIVGYNEQGDQRGANRKQGLESSKHAARIIGYSEDGLPYSYDYGKITPLGEGLYNISDLNNITIPKGVENNTYANLKYKFKSEDAKPIELNYSGKTKYDPKEFEPFLEALGSEKEKIVNTLNITNEEYDKYAKQAAALALAETRGGDNTIMRKLPLNSTTGAMAAALTLGTSIVTGVPSYILDKLGVGDSRGITQVTDSQLWDEKGNVKHKMNRLGLTKSNYDAWDPKHQAASTIAMLRANDTGTEVEGLDENQIAAYKWNNPKALRSGNAKGDSPHVRKFIEELSNVDVKSGAVDFDFTKPTGFATGGYINDMKTKRKQTKGYFTGGEIALIANYVSGLSNDYISAFTKKEFDPSADPYKINWSKLATQGTIGIIPEVIKMMKDKKQRESYVPTATPGNYSKGGNIDNNREVPSQHGHTMLAKDGKTGKGYDSSGRKVWRKGMKDDGSGELTIMQDFLKSKGFYDGEVDGIYGAKTEAAVKKYQEWFNKNAKREMFYTPDGKTSERIGGPKGKKILVDGIVGDQTRTALLYREMPKEEKKTEKKKEWMEPEFPVGEGINKYRATDYTPTDFPDSPMNYSGGLEMLGLALMGTQIGGAALGADAAAASAAKSLMQNGLKGVGRTTRVPLNPNIPKALQGTGGRSFAPKTPSAYGTRIGYAMGGEMDEQLSSRAFEVEADPSRIDSKHYPHLNAKLDHGEVVTDNKFVFSNRLKNPQTGETFAEEAEALQKVVGKSEKIRKTNPYDAFANNTININNKRTENLAQLQEALATMMGHRNDRPKGMALGGYTQGPGDPPYTFLLSRKDMPNDFFTNISPQQWADFTNPVNVATGQRRRPITADYFIGRKLEPNQAVMDMGRDGMFYDPYTKKFVVRNKKGEYVGVQPNAGQFEVSGDIVKDLTTGKTFNTKEHLAYMAAPKMQSAGPDGPALGVPSNVLQNIEGAGTAPLIDPFNPFIPRDPGLPKVTPTPPQGGSGKGRVKPKATGNPKATTSPLDGQAEYDLFKMRKYQEEYESLKEYENWKDANEITGGIATDTTDVMQMAGGVAPLTLGENLMPPPSGENLMPPPSGDQIRNKFTAGDALQALEVASKFGQLIGGADVEMPNFDTTRITKETFDPRNALYQSNRTLQNALNTMEAPSINMRRNMANSLYAQKLGQDNTILSEYNRMNQGANTQFEQRQADQRRYNIGQTNYTEDLNQRNKDTYRNAIQNAFTSLGNFGEGLNQKKMGTDALNILKKSYPQVYQRIMEMWLEEENAAKKAKKEEDAAKKAKKE